MSNRRNNHRNGRKSTPAGRQHWVHPTRGLRRERAAQGQGYAVIGAFVSRCFIPEELLKPWA